MHSEAFATTEMPGTEIPEMEIPGTDITGMPQPILGSLGRSPRAILQLAPEPKEIDACLYLFALCKYFQMSRLEGRRLDCLVDGEGVGKLPEAVCRLLGLMVCELIKAGGAAATAPANLPQAVAVTLRKRGTTCLCIVSCQGLIESQEDMATGLQQIRQLAAGLSGGCLVRSMPERGITAIMIDIPSVERSFPAISRHRGGNAGH